MRIPVLCPSCGASFTVSENFAGKTGPCPKCKTPIPVPTLEEIGAAGPTTPASGVGVVAGKKIESPTAGSAGPGRGGLMPPPKGLPAAGRSAAAPAAPEPPAPAVRRTGLTRAPAGGSTPAASPLTPNGAVAPNEAVSPNGPAAPKIPPAPARSAPGGPPKAAKDLSPAAKIAAKLDNRSLIRGPGVKNPGPEQTTSPAKPGKPGAPQQLGVGTGRQAPITDEVIIHEPDAYAQGGTDKKGRPILKPLTRQDVKFRAINLVLTLVGVLLVFGVDWYLGRTLDPTKGLLHIAVWLLIAASSVPLALGAYWVLAPSEAEPYSGSQLWIRTGACAAVYSLLWIARAFIPPDYTDQLYYWAGIAPPFFIIGAATAFLAYDLEGENTLFHFTLFLVVSVLLRGVAGLPWV